MRVGLAGSGEWAAGMHAPLHAAGAATELVGVWSRTPERTAALAAVHGVPHSEHYRDLVAASDAVDIAVPPSAQADLAVEAARAGRALILEKPLGASSVDARRVYDAAREAGVPTLVAFTRRYSEPLDAFLRDVRGRAARDRARQRRPGPTVRLLAGRRGRLVFEIDLFGHEPRAHHSSDRIDVDAVWARVRRELADAARTGSVPTVDVTRALHVQEILDAAVRSLASSGAYQEV